MSPHRIRLAAGPLVAALLPLSAWAQTRLSERGTVGQTIDGTSITVDYARPQARGRSPIFGQVVHWGEVWTPGANWATNITLSKDVKVNGAPLAKGSYSMWLIPKRDSAWTVLFHPTVRLFHTQRPNPDSATLRLAVTPTPIEPAEILTFGFTTVGRDRTTLEMRWEKALVPLEIVVTPTRPVLAADQAPAYTGTWTVLLAGEAGKVDTVDFQIDFKDGRLIGEFPKWGWAMELLPTRTRHAFLLGMLEKGELLDVEADYPLVFAMAGDRAASFIVKSDTNDEWMRGVRR